MWDGIENGVTTGLIAGALLPFATPAVLTGVGVVGTGLGVAGTIDAASQGNYGQAVFRGVLTAGGAAGFKLLNFRSKQYRLQLMEMIRVRARALSLSPDSEIGGGTRYLQGLGLARLEQALKITVSTANEAGVDGIAPGLGRIQLKGPYLKEGDLSLLSASQRQAAIGNTISKAGMLTTHWLLMP